MRPTKLDDKSSSNYWISDLLDLNAKDFENVFINPHLTWYQWALGSIKRNSKKLYQPRTAESKYGREGKPASSNSSNTTTSSANLNLTSHKNDQNLSQPLTVESKTVKISANSSLNVPSTTTK
ncbi:unnamed protein product [Brachionus calyciflorus]|uniref:Uncharacterized protein n=1 Tax=Brachionus calyciflorus TaxID=104777 RepID=A0A814GFH2_9BILA|nr:unnamed protein product [Brachionus calyciflorus]